MTDLVFLAVGVVTSVYDGDTITVDLDIGWHVHLTDRHIRIAHINAPEMTTPEGAPARDYARSLLPSGTLVGVKSLTKPDKYGRVLAEITLPDGSDLAGRMIAAGFAVPYEGGTK